MAEYSKNEQAQKLFGLRRTNVIAIDVPAELGFRCPVCKNNPEENGNFDERLEWSEYNAFLWCSVCNRDYPSALCQENPISAIDIFIRSVEDAIALANNPMQATFLRSASESA